MAPVFPVSTCTLTAVGPDGEPDGNVEFSVQVVRGTKIAGRSVSRRIMTATSHVSTGVLTFTLIRTARYKIWRSSDPSRARPFTVDDASTYSIPEVLGQP